MNQPFIKYNILFLLILSMTVFAEEQKNSPTQFLIVLGIAQDAGFPQAGCKKSCCAAVWQQPGLRKMVASIGIVDEVAGKSWLVEATPDLRFQMRNLQSNSPALDSEIPDGIFLTHAHIGHYTGLMYLGRESMGAKHVPVFAMPQMTDFLQLNGPWKLLVELENIRLMPIAEDSVITLSEHLTIQPIRVPHRDEFSETVAFRINGREKSALFIPDIDKWNQWNHNIINEISKVDVAFLDGTFFENGEIPGRDMSEIPHPFISESMALFDSLPESERAKIVFIHFNHTNPVMQPDSDARKLVIDKGYKIAEEGMRIQF